MQANTLLAGTMPILGFGTWEIKGKQCRESVESAINIGYEHIDTAQMYENEHEVGLGIKNSNKSRDEIFLTTKVATSKNTPSGIKESTENSLKKLQTDYINLLLIHWPTPEMDLKACLETMFELKIKGVIRNVGVSNFSPDLFKKALEIGPVVNNQVKFSPYSAQFDTLDVARENGITLTAYSPLERGDVIDNNVLGDIGDKYGKSASQVALRWLIQLGNVAVIPKAQSKEHRIENFEIFDFELDDEDLNMIGSLHGV